MTTIQGFLNNMPEYKKNLFRNVILGKLPDDLLEALSITDYELVIDAENRTYEFRNCPEPLLTNIMKALKS